MLTALFIAMYLVPLQEQEEITRRHEVEVRTLHQKLDLHTDTSLDRFKQNTLVCLCPFLSM